MYAYPPGREPNKYGMIDDPAHHLPCNVSSGHGMLTTRQMERFTYAMTRHPFTYTQTYGARWVYATEFIAATGDIKGLLGLLRFWVRHDYPASDSYPARSSAELGTFVIVTDEYYAANEKPDPDTGALPVWWFERDESEWPKSS